MCREIIIYELNSLREIAKGVMSNNINLLTQSILKLKSWVTPRDAPVDEIVHTGIVPRLVELYFTEDFPDRFEARVILVYLTRSGDTSPLINNNVVPLILDLLRSDIEEECLLAVWALGNLAKYSQGRQLVLDSTFMPFVLSQFNEQSSSVMVRLAARALANLCKGNLKRQQTSAALTVLSRILRSEGYAGIYPCGLKALFHLTVEGDTVTLLKVIAWGFLPLLNGFLSDEWQTNHFVALHTLHNIMLDAQCLEHVIAKQPLPPLNKLLRRTGNNHIKKEICQIVPLIATLDSNSVVQSGIMEAIISLLENNDTTVTEYAVEAVYLVIHDCFQEMRVLIVEQGCIDLMCNLIKSPQSETVLHFAIAVLGDIMHKEEAEADAGEFKSIIINAGVFIELSKLICTDGINDEDLYRLALGFVLRFAPIQDYSRVGPMNVYDSQHMEED